MKKKVIKLEKEKTTFVEQEADGKSKNQVSCSGSVISIAMEMGFSIALPTAGGALLGVYLDQKFDTLPKLTLSLLFLGLIIGIYNVYQMVSVELKEE